jgi:uroporphyrinogen decarboxylase
MRRIADAIKARRPGIPVIAFPRGVGPLAREVAEVASIDAVGLDTGLAASWAAREVQPLKAVQGNLDPLLVVAGGSAMLDEADRILATLGHGPFIFNLGHGIVPHTPPEHVGALVDRVKAWRA